MRTDDHVISSKPADHLSQDSWVRIKYGTYKGDLAKVMYVDNVRQKVRVKLIPRIDLQALADKLQGKQVEKEKDKSRPQQRLMDSDEALKRKIKIGLRKDPKGRSDFECIDGMLFRFGFLHKTVPIKSISTQSIQPSHDELVNFQEPIESDDEEEEITPLSEAIYFSDLSEKQVMELFCKYPLFRFEILSVTVKWKKNLGKKLKLSGFIQAAADSLGGPSPSSVKKYEYNDTVAPVQGEVRTLYLANSRCSIPASNSVQIHAELHVTALKVDDLDDNEMGDKLTTEKEEVVEKDDMYHNEVERGDDADDLCSKLLYDREDDVERDDDDDVVLESSFLLAEADDLWSKILYDREDDVEGDDDDDVVERDDDDLDFDAAMLRLGGLYANIGISDMTCNLLDIYDKRTKDWKYYVEYGNYNESVVDYNEAFEVGSEQFSIDFSKFPKGPYCNGGVFGSNIIKGKYGSIELSHVALKYAVDAVLEVELDVPSKEITVTRVTMYAYYGSNVKPAEGKPYYQGIIVDTEPVKPGKIKLMRNRFAVPATSCLVIFAAVDDFTSCIFSGYYEFHVPLNGGSSVGLIEEEKKACSFKLKMDWKLPDDSRSLG